MPVKATTVFHAFQPVGPLRVVLVLVLEHLRTGRFEVCLVSNGR
jgi:hypothetical protein